MKTDLLIRGLVASARATYRRSQNREWRERWGRCGGVGVAAALSPTGNNTPQPRSLFASHPDAGGVAVTVNPHSSAKRKAEQVWKGSVFQEAFRI